MLACDTLVCIIIVLGTNKSSVLFILYSVSIERHLRIVLCIVALFDCCFIFIFVQTLQTQNTGLEVEVEPRVLYRKKICTFD